MKVMEGSGSPRTIQVNLETVFSRRQPFGLSNEMSSIGTKCEERHKLYMTKYETMTNHMTCHMTGQVTILTCYRHKPGRTLSYFCSTIIN